MAVATAKGLFNDHFSTPALATWKALKNGAQNSITGEDIAGNLWNTLVCSAPLIAGGQVAYKINLYAHKHWLLERQFKQVSSFIFTAVSFIAGASVSFFAIRVLFDIGGTLSPFTADKALRLATLNSGVLAAAKPISTFFGSSLHHFFEVPIHLGATAAVSGYFGERSLYVIGALSALTYAVNARCLGWEEFYKRIRGE